MAKFVPTNLLAQYDAVSKLNANFDAIAALFENTLSRDGTAPNSMMANLDMNHFRVENIGDGLAGSDAVSVDQLNQTLLNLGVDISGAIIPATSRSLMASITNTAVPALLAEDGREGLFVFSSANLASAVAKDTDQQFYIAPNTDPTGASGAWVRRLDSNLATGPRKLSYGVREVVRSIRAARTELASLSSQVVGWAKQNGITGGEGKAEYYVNSAEWDTATENTIGWALDQAKTNGGGLIYFDPRGKFDVIVTDTTTFRLDDGHDNISIFAPGRNVTVWTDPLNGAVILKGANLIIKGIYFRSMSGPMSGDFDGVGTKVEQDVVTLFPQNADSVAFINCEFRHASDGALDMASTAFDGTSSPCHVTIQDCIFWDTDEVTVIGANVNTTAVGDTRKMFVTYYNTIFAYCGQRLPKILGLSSVDMVNCLTIINPFQHDQPAPATEFGGGSGVGVTNGAWVRCRGCLWTAATGSGYAAINITANAISGETGYADVVNCATEDGITTTTASPGSVPAVPYTLPHIAVPAAGTAREQWIKDRWATAGARGDAAPEGQFVWTPSTTAYPNGETVLIDRVRAGRWIRIDPRLEYPSAAVVSDQTVEATPRTYTRNVGYTEGKTAKPAIGPTMLDIINDTGSVYTIQGNAGPANLKHIVNTSGTAIPDGFWVRVMGSASNPVTLKNSTTIVVTGSAAADTITATAHGETVSGFPVVFSNSGGALPGGLSSATVYYGIYVDANTFKVATSYPNAIAGTAINLTTDGTGTNSVAIGNFNLPGGRDIVLDSTADGLLLYYNTGSHRFNIFGGDYATASGTYTPTLTAVANCSGLAVTRASYMKNGKIVSVAVWLTGTQTTASTLTQVGISLPIASNFTTNQQCIGQTANNAAIQTVGYITGDSVNDRATATFTCSAASAAAFTLIANFQYEIA